MIKIACNMHDRLARERQEPVMRPVFESQDAREGALAFAEREPRAPPGR